MFVRLNGACKFDGIGLSIDAWRDVSIFVLIVIARFWIVVIVIVAVPPLV